MAYTEPLENSIPERQRLSDQVAFLIQNRRAVADQIRALFFSPDFSSVSSFESSLLPYRQKLTELLGWPLTELSQEHPVGHAEKIAEDEWGRIYRVHIHTIGEVSAYGLFFLPPAEGKYPLVLAQHGGLGAPEVASGIAHGGTYNYNRLIQGLREKKSVAIFAAQLLVWHEGQEPKIDQYKINRDLRQLGGSRAALDLSMLKRSLDWLVLHPEINADRIGMAGLSYGGFYTLFFTALEPRIRVAVSSCFANDRYAFNWGDWVWSGSANMFMDAEVASMICPRPLFVEVGEKDEVFKVEGFSKVNESIQKTYERLGLKDKYQSRIHSGSHEYDTDGEAERFLLRWL